MATPYLGEIRLTSFSFPPKGWAACNGQLLPINQNQALFSLLGTFYGGDGQVTFGLPNLQARVPMHTGNGHIQGESGGEVGHTLTAGEMAAHTHALPVTTAVGKSSSPAEALPAVAPTGLGNVYGLPTNLTPMQAAVGSAGAGAPHPNQQPCLVVNFVIALVGIYPSRD